MNNKIEIILLLSILFLSSFNAIGQVDNKIGIICSDSCVTINSIGACSNCNPSFIYSNNDTIIIGGEEIEEGSINGEYKYFILNKDTLSLFKQVNIQGHAPWDENSNPIKGVICKRILTTHFYNYGQNQKMSPIIYECTDKNKNQIYGKILAEAIDLYQMYWGGIGDIVETVKMKNEKVKVGEIIYYHGNSYIAIEINNKWFWTLKNKISIEKSI